MKIITPKEIGIDHIMWQPTSNCNEKCDGCYVRKSIASKYKGPLQTEILDLIFKYKTVLCSQFTISLDTFLQPKEAHKALARSIDWLFNCYNESKELKNLPDLCITARDINSVERWCCLLGMELSQFLGPIKILSLSSFPVQEKEIKNLENICKRTQTVLNYNVLIRENTSTKKEFGIGCKHADQIYIVLYKEALGLHQKYKAVKDLLKAAAVASKIAKGKVYIDRCLLDSDHYIETGEKCGAGIEKIHIWPNGMATACPYDSGYVVAGNSSSEKQNTWVELSKIINSTMCHPMSFCSIPGVLQDIKKDYERLKKTVDN